MLNETTAQVLSFICAYLRDHRYAPSITEIAEVCFMARSTALRHLDKLEAKGWIERTPGRARSIILLKETLVEG